MSHHLELSPADRADLVALRDRAPLPDLRERAAALLKIADGASAAAVARTGLLRPHQPETIYRGLHRYRSEGIAGVVIRPGRGRTPAFSPSARHSARHRRGGPDRPAPRVAPGSPHLRPGPQPVAAG